MARVGFLGRVMLILMVALVALMGLTLGINHLERRSFVKPTATSYPRVVSAAGIIVLVRAAEPGQKRNILNAANTKLLRVRLMDVPPEPDGDDVRAPRAERLLRNMIGHSIERLEAYTTTDELYAKPEKLGIEGPLMRVDATEPDGRTLVIDWMATSKLASLKVLGLQPGVWTGILGFGVAALALFTVFREIRPLRRLTASVSSFDGGRIEPFEARGAPDIRRLIEAVHRMQERVATLLRERSFLIGAISHDLRTYLTRLRLRTEEVEHEGLRERMTADLDTMTRLIETSLAFARGTTTSQTRSRVDLGDLVAIEVEEHNALGLPLALEGTYANDAIVVGDPVALRRVVANILDNALRFARASVTVRVDRTVSHERITIEDDGPGIPAEKRSAVFSPFYRIDQARSHASGGTGLGLAIARQIVEAHGGTIEVSAGATRGAAFIVALPSCQR